MPKGCQMTSNGVRLHPRVNPPGTTGCPFRRPNRGWKSAAFSLRTRKCTPCANRHRRRGWGFPLLYRRRSEIYIYLFYLLYFLILTQMYGTRIQIVEWLIDNESLFCVGAPIRDHMKCQWNYLRQTFVQRSEFGHNTLSREALRKYIHWRHSLRSTPLRSKPRADWSKRNNRCAKLFWLLEPSPVQPPLRPTHLKLLLISRDFSVKLTTSK